MEMIQKHLPLRKMTEEDPSLTQSELNTFFRSVQKKFPIKNTENLNLFQQESSAPVGNTGKKENIEGPVLYINFDGASKGNPGHAGAGIAVSTEDGTVVLEDSLYLGKITNNAAEYKACLLSLDKAVQLNPSKIIIRSDSQLLVRQVNGEYKVKNPSLAVLHNEVKSKLFKFPDWKIEHVRREYNKLADKLANEAVKNHLNGIRNK